MLWLTKSQLKSKNVETRRKAIEELCRKPSARALDTLATALEDEDDEVRRLAIMALAKLEHEQARDLLLFALRDREPEVVKAAIPALKKYDDSSVKAALIPVLNHSDSGVRGHAAQALELLGWIPKRTEDKISMLVAKREFSRAAAFGAAAVPALEAAIFSPPSSVGVGVVQALSEINDLRARRAIARALQSADPAVCVAAVDALRFAGDPSAAEPLLTVLRHQVSQVRAAAVEALGRLRLRSSAETLLPLLRDDAWEVRRETAEALGRLGDIKAIEPLAALLSDEDADVRETTALALGNLADRRAIRFLVLALRDGASGVRRIAAAALSRIDPRWNDSPEARDALQDLKAALPECDSNARHHATQLLVSLGVMDSSPDAGVQPEQSGSASPDIRRKLAVSLFTSVLADHDRDLRQAAAQALGRIGDPRVKSVLLRAQADADAGVRAAAQKSLDQLAALPN